MAGSSQGAFSFGVRAGLSSSSATAALLAHETSLGSFSGVLDMLDAHHALLVEVQQSCYGMSLHDVEFRVNMLLRPLRFVVEQVWQEYQSWKYIRIGQQIEIGYKCVQIFERILADQTLAHATPATAQLRDFVEAALVAPTASPLTVAPLLHVIINGQEFVHGLQKANRADDVDMARTYIEASLRLARTIVECRMRRTRQGQHRDGAPFGLVEQAFIEDPPWQSSANRSARRRKGSSLKRSLNLASATMNSIYASEDYGIACEAAKLITTVCGALAEAAVTPTPTLVSRLGSPSDVEAMLVGLLDLVENENEYGELRALTLNMLAALIAGQPIFATLLLTGKHVAASVASEDASQAASGKVLKRTALEIAVKFVQECNLDTVCSDVGEVQCLEAALKLLGVAWQSALEHGQEFESTRQSTSFWKRLLHVACRESGTYSTSPELLTREHGDNCTERDGEVKLAAFAKTCSARALHLIATDINMAPMLRRRSRQKEQSPRNHWPSLICVTELLRDRSGLQKALQSAMQVQCDPLRHDEVLTRMEEAFPELPLNELRVPERLNDFDTGKQYGNAYVYGLETLRDKLSGLLQGTATTEAVEAGVNEHVVQQAMLLVAGINLDWSAIDAQTIYLRSWSALLSAVVGPLFDRMVDENVFARDIRRNVTSVWLDCARIVTDEQLSTGITQDIHVLRVSLLAVLLEIAWGQAGPPQENRQLQSDFGEQDMSWCVGVMELTARIVTHPVLSIEDAMRNAPLSSHSTSLHRDAARIVLVCTRQFRAVRRKLNAGDSDALTRSIGAGVARNGDAERLRDMQRSAEVFTSHTITTMRIALDRCLASLASSATADDAVVTALDLDWRLLAATLTLLLHQDGGISAHVWLPKLHTSSLFQVACDLFGRAPLMRSVDKAGGAGGYNYGAVDETAGGVALCYWQTLLDLFLDLACQASTAEALILAGVMNALSVNALSSALEIETSSSTDAITMRLLMTTGMREQTLQGSWIKMLRIVTALTSVLDVQHQQAFVHQQVSSFFRIFHPLLDACLERQLFDLGALGPRLRNGGDWQSAGAGVRTPHASTDKARLNDLAETELALTLYGDVLRVYVHEAEVLESTEMAENAPPALGSGSLNEQSRRRHTSAVRQHVDLLVTSYVARTTLRLQEAVHLLQHPHELAALLGLDNLSDGASGGGSAGSKGQRQKHASASTATAKHHLMQICISIVQSFWRLGHGYETLCSAESSEWLLDDVVIIPTIGTSPTRPSSIGTLLDLASYLTDALRSLDASEDASLSSLLSALEQTLSLSTVQLALAMYGHASSHQPFGASERTSLTKAARIQSTEVEAGLGRDVTHLTDAAAAALLDVGGEDATRLTRAYVDVVIAFQRRWLVPSSE